MLGPFAASHLTAVDVEGIEVVEVDGGTRFA